MKKEDTSKNKAAAVYEAPPGGSLGLLALGYRGLIAWRAALKKYKEENPEAGKENDAKKKS